MKHVVLIVLAILSVLSCSQPSEDKVKTLIRESVIRSLSHPGSYMAIETVVDSAFAPFDDPVFREKTLEICRMTIENLEYVRKAQEAGQDIHPKEYALITVVLYLLTVGTIPYFLAIKFVYSNSSCYRKRNALVRRSEKHIKIRAEDPMYGLCVIFPEPHEL